MMNALIIDDEMDICYLLSSILKNSFKTECVNSLADAIIALQKNSPAVVFLDNHLPDGMGMDFIAYIKKNSPDTKIIMVTAYDNSSDRNKALKLGVDFFVGKPFTKDTIYQAVDLVSH